VLYGLYVDWFFYGNPIKGLENNNLINVGRSRLAAPGKSECIDSLIRFLVTAAWETTDGIEVGRARETERRAR
jgi:hypothetical protein